MSEINVGGDSLRVEYPLFQVEGDGSRITRKKGIMDIKKKDRLFKRWWRKERSCWNPESEKSNKLLAKIAWNQSYYEMEKENAVYKK